MLKIIAFIASILLLVVTQQASSKDRAKNCPDVREIPAGNLLLFGEMHGSVEAPAMIAQVACSLSNEKPVAVGLEISSKDQLLIDFYLVSKGTEADQDRLFESDFWEYGNDGRASSAIFNLIETIRIWKKDGRAIGVFAFDDQPGSKLERNVAIAAGIRRYHESHPETKIVALMGNIHASLEPLYIGGKELVPSGNLLKDLHPVSIFIAYPAGSIWACMPTCEIQAMEAVSGVSGPPGFKLDSPRSGYSYGYLLSSITASPPVVK